ncbi:MAG: hypothetical protein ACRCS9_08235 [Hyphomicrobium sp.]
MNVALYGNAGKRWAMTERGRHDLSRDDTHLSIGASRMTWTGDRLIIDIDEIGVPVPRRIKGRITLHPSAIQSRAFELDANGQHLWQPIAPVARVDVQLQNPRLSWPGHGYFDHNTGTCPLEQTFHRWHWSRTSAGPTTRILYDVDARDGRDRSLALSIGPDGIARTFDAPPMARLPSTYWRIARATRSDIGAPPAVMTTLEDTPFYARSIVSSQLEGEATTAMHESLDLDRFNTRIVQAMLPFRMPRRARPDRPDGQNAKHL